MGATAACNGDRHFLDLLRDLACSPSLPRPPRPHPAQSTKSESRKGVSETSDSVLALRRAPHNKIKGDNSPRRPLHRGHGDAKSVQTELTGMLSAGPFNPPDNFLVFPAIFYPFLTLSTRLSSYLNSESTGLQKVD